MDYCTLTSGAWDWSNPLTIKEQRLLLRKKNKQTNKKLKKELFVLFVFLNNLTSDQCSERASDPLLLMVPFHKVEWAKVRKKKKNEGWQKSVAAPMNDQSRCRTTNLTCVLDSKGLLGPYSTAGRFWIRRKSGWTEGASYGKKETCAYTAAITWHATWYCDLVKCR